MKKSPHQIFVDELQKQLNDTPRQSHASNNKKRAPDEDACKKNIMSELERKFDELFGDLDDDN